MNLLKYKKKAENIKEPQKKEERKKPLHWLCDVQSPSLLNGTALLLLQSEAFLDPASQEGFSQPIKFPG